MPLTRHQISAKRCSWLALLLCELAAGLLGGRLTAATAGDHNFASQPAADIFAIETWHTDRGLPQNSVNALIQSRQGYLWLGTYNGLARFDGARFVVFDAANTRVMRNSRITSLYEDSKTNLWIGHENGELTRMTNGMFQDVNLSNRWPGGAVQNICEDEHLDLWLLSIEGSVMRLRDGLVIKRFPGIGHEPGGAPEMLNNSDGSLIVSRNGAVAAIQNGNWLPLHFGDPAAYYDRVVPAHEGGIWVASSGVIRRWAGGWVAEARSLPVGISFTTTMKETRSGKLLIGTINAGLILCEPGGRSLSISTEDDLPQQWVKCLLEDREGNLWIGTRGGLTVLRSRKVNLRSPPDNWQHVTPLAVCPDGNGTVWAGSEGAGLYHFDGQIWTHFGEPEGLLNPYVWSVLADAQGAVWAGTWSGGLFRGRDGKFTVPDELSQLKDPIMALLESPAGTLWIGTGKGLARLKNGRLDHFASLGGAAAGDIRALEAGREGEIWIGTFGSGLGRFANGTLQNFTTRDGLPGDFILSLHHESDDTLWIGTLEQGLGRLKQGKFSVLDIPQGLPSHVIGNISEDNQGKLWFNSSQGIFSANQSDLNRVADNPDHDRVNCQVYGTSDGLTILSGSSGFTPSGFCGRNGHLWFPNSSGLAEVNPAQVRPNRLPPPVVIEGLSIAGHEAFNADNLSNPDVVLRVPPGSQQIEIRFTGLSFSAPEKVRFKWQLEGLEKQWSEPQSCRNVTYSYLPPGKYIFRVMACNNDDLWNENSATLAFVALPHFWETWWFKLALLSFGLLIFGVSIAQVQRTRLRRKLDKIVREREIEEERSRIARDIHDDLGASLTRIGMLSQTAAETPADTERTAHYLAQIYAAAREMTSSMDEIVWAVNPRHDTLESLFNYLTRFAHEFLMPAKIRCRLQVPVVFPERTVRSDVRHNLFLAFKETLNNVVRHSGADEVKVSICQEGNLLKILVADNGHGAVVQPAAADSPRPIRLVGGHGFTNIQSRLEKIGGQSRVTSTAGQGTIVELSAPLSQPGRPRTEARGCHENTG